MIKIAYQFYEFFAGGGMARIGLGESWQCTFANDIDSKKAASYRSFFGEDSHLVVDDIANITTDQLMGTADLAWASFPCQDLSLAGEGAGLSGNRSGTFWPFWRLITQLRNKGRAPKMIVLENVYGAITSNGGRDLSAIIEAIIARGYKVGLIVVDAVHFLPQSRVRVFIIAVDAKMAILRHLLSDGPTHQWHPASLGNVYDLCSESARSNWLWWNLPTPPVVDMSIVDLIEDDPDSVKWHTPLETQRLLGMMTPINLAKVETAKRTGKIQIGALYKRTRTDTDGVKRQRAEVRFDDVVGCLRTPIGGSSRQTLLIVNGEEVRSRLLSPREAARLMGLPETYTLPRNYNEAYHLIGDGVAVPVVNYLSQNILTPMLNVIHIEIVA